MNTYSKFSYSNFIDDDTFLKIIVNSLYQKGHFKTKKRRNKTSRVFDYWGSQWGLLLNNPQTMDILSYEGRLFRRRFRLPFPVFKEILVPKCEEFNIFDNENPGKVIIPLEIKLLGCLRILGRDSCADDINELSGIPGSSMNHLFKKFCTNFVQRIYPQFVKLPDKNKLKKIMEVYTKLGAPGACGSMDCTRTKWDMCPVDIRQSAIGKEGYPTLVFQVIVDHSRLIHYCSHYFLGGNNDCNTTYNDEFPRMVMRGYYKDVEFQLYDEDGILKIYLGGYFLIISFYNFIFLYYFFDFIFIFMNF